MPKKHYLTIAATAMLGLSSLSAAFAGTETAAPGKESKAVTPPCPVTYITGDFGVTVTNEYVSRGLVLQERGTMVQPYLDIYIKLYSGDANSWGINSISGQLSFWSEVSNNYIHSGEYNGVKGVKANSTVPAWYEFDWDPGFSVTFAQKFTLLLQYFEFDSPAGAFNTARSINATLTYDDSSLLGAFAVHPHFTVLNELGGNKGGSAGINPYAWYYELGIAPSYTFMPKSTYPITVSVPFTVGLGDTFYASNNFGYFSVGPAVSVPLAFIPSGFGSWTVTASYLYYYEGTTVRAFNASQTYSGANSRNVFSGAIGCTF